jgi:hypothetical protein
MQTTRNRPRRFPPKAQQKFLGRKAAKRFVYPLDYPLFTFACLPVYLPAYLPSTGRIVSLQNDHRRLLVCPRNIASPGASCWLFQNQKNKGI